MAAAAPLSRPVCTSCHKTKEAVATGRLQTCSRCRTVYYCSTECQKGDWARHRDDCKRFMSQLLGLRPLREGISRERWNSLARMELCRERVNQNPRSFDVKKVVQAIREEAKHASDPRQKAVEEALAAAIQGGDHAEISKLNQNLRTLMVEHTQRLLSKCPPEEVRFEWGALNRIIKELQTERSEENLVRNFETLGWIGRTVLLKYHRWRRQAGAL